MSSFGPNEPETTEIHWNDELGVWTVTTSKETLSISGDDYDRIMREQLLKKGIHQKTWNDYMRDVELAFSAQSKEERRLNQDLAFWKSRPEVKATPHS